MQRDRVVGVDGPRGPGSGYVVGGRLVLTSAHVVPETGGTARVFRPGWPGTHRSRVVWRGTPGGRDDAALLVVEDGDAPRECLWEPVRGVVRWGRLATSRPRTPCESWGLADLVQRPGRAADTVQPVGTLSPGDRFVGNRYVMALDAQPPEPLPGGGSPWGGMSGAALFCGDLLTGVIAVDPGGRGHAALEAVPLYVLLHDDGFRAALADHAPEAGQVLEPVEFQHLAEHHTAETALRTPAALLRARVQAVPFRGRARLLRDLHAWAREPGFAARLLHGPGGQGKTRLAHQAAVELAADRWSTLWLRPDVPEDGLAALADTTGPLLVVADYAETVPARLAALVHAAGRDGGTAPVKLLLLARTAGDWWRELAAHDRVTEELLDGAPATAVEALEPDAGASRAEAYGEAVTGFAAHLPKVRGHERVDWAALAAGLPAPDVRGAGLRSALTLHMTALADLLDAAAPGSPTGEGPAINSVGMPEGAAPGLLADRIEDRLLIHEERYWHRTAETRGLRPYFTTGTLTEALTAALVLGAGGQEQGDGLLRGVPGLADQSADRIRAVREWIADLYPSAGGGRPWDGLQPDRLTERFAGRQLAREPGLFDRLAAGADEAQARQLLTVCARAAAHPVFGGGLDQPLTALCVRHPGVLAVPAVDVATHTEAPAPLVAALREVAGAAQTSLELLEALVARLPETSQNLAAWAAALTSAVAERRRHIAREDPAAAPALAKALNDLAVRLGQNGQRDEAVAVIGEAVALWRGLADADPAAHQPALARSLNTQGIRLSAVGRSQEALRYVTEAVAIRRELAAQRPESACDDLARTLNTLCLRLAELGGDDAALAAITEAVAIRRELTRAHPGRYEAALANNLSNLAARLAAVGRKDEALTAVTEAVALKRDLVALRPDSHRPSLARSLNNLAVRLGAVGRKEEALAPIREAVAIRRDLVRLRPDAHRPDLAKNLNNLAVRLADLGRLDEALEAITEAVALRRELAEAQPEDHARGLANSRGHQARILAALAAGNGGAAVRGIGRRPR
ncbi:tetratricopeptide repeat protein [Streptomyces sp. NPDC051976]|uniref:tetratricopeptide repeat protein n=1 Tax=Streptomyces sp. NPDC051976 TaxID=3154947 RepID=UPI00342B8402